MSRSRACLALYCNYGLLTLLLRKSRGEIDEWMLSYTKWQHRIFWPVETAITQLKDAIDLLVKVGADFNIGIHAAYTQNTEAPGRKTIIDAVRGMLTVAKKDIESTPKDSEWDDSEQPCKSTYQELVKLDGWKGAFGKALMRMREESASRSTFHPHISGTTQTRPPPIVEEAEDDFISMDADNMSGRKHLTTSTALREKVFANLQHSVEYLTKVEALLTAQGAKSWKELHPDDVTAENHADFFYSTHSRPFAFFYSKSYRSLKSGFERLTSTSRFVAVASYLEGAYEELFQACYNGDNAKIEQLCLPPKDEKTDKQLTQISVRFGDGGGRCLFSPPVSCNAERILQEQA